MRNWIRTLVALALVVTAFIPSASYAQSDEKSRYTDTVTLMIDSKSLYHNGERFESQRENTIVDGVTYTSLRSFAERLSLTLSFDNETKIVTLIGKGIHLSFQADSERYTVDGEAFTSEHGVPFIDEGVLMVPVKLFAQPFDIVVMPGEAPKTVDLFWSTVAYGQFSIEPTKIYATQTEVTYIDDYRDRGGAPILDEVWSEKYDVFPEAGVYTITRSVLTEDGVWQPPYSVTVTVLPPNQAPEASFRTNKDVYKIGEPINYYDDSTDAEDAIVSTDWFNKEPAFFEAGKQEIMIKVTDDFGLTGTFSKTITITDEVMYTRDEYNQLFVPVGEKYSFQGNLVPSIEKVPYTIVNRGYNLFRSNSPESALEDGIYYEDIISGPTRVMIHHQNHQAAPVRFYLVATNPNAEPIKITIPHVGIGGPHESIYLTGKLSVARYLETLNTPDNRVITLKPGESKVVMTPMSAAKVPYLSTISAHGDILTDNPLKLQMVILKDSKDLFESLPTLKKTMPDGVHKRGTYNNATKSIRLDRLLGETPMRLSLGDGTRDVNYKGRDGITGEVVDNDGIFGVVHTVQLERVAPNTLVSINARGGYYSGSFSINGEIIQATKVSHLLTPDEKVVLYRTGDTEELLEIQFIPASGSNLPLALLLEPLPEVKH
ncbi:stalk domain-containing protein [Fusibacter sp. JL298sf-3]